ncbi:uncharacterized protein B0H18DRAFT_957201 [Fomitopsis serialis]|uniref:uncharacterized protein n=1 Tax=Fomitopsis serialis TaxID=139415 RepID=UPI002008B50A|nr:uncharacterized protein B0H18DRAFT_957201 [Neoantrodia serialis]KAH9920148.1 hypothetical protein B0H18DRAFT_957201 [Neoantrodia serialis]
MSQYATADLVTLYQQNFQYDCAQAAIIAVLTYEYAITLQDEAQFVWGRRATSTGICCLNRLIMIGLIVANMLDMYQWTTNALPGRFPVVRRSGTYDVPRVGGWFAAAITLAFALVPVAYNLFACSRLIYLAVEIIPGLTVCTPVNKLSVSVERKCACHTNIRHRIRFGGVIGHHMEILRLCVWVSVPGVEANSDGGASQRRGDLLHLFMDYVASIDVGAAFIVPAMTILISRFILDIRKTGLSRESDTELTTYTDTGYPDSSRGLFTTRVDFYGARATELDSDPDPTGCEDV